jgi:hypothetical protein
VFGLFSRPIQISAQRALRQSRRFARFSTRCQRQRDFVHLAFNTPPHLSHRCQDPWPSARFTTPRLRFDTHSHSFSTRDFSSAWPMYGLMSTRKESTTSNVAYNLHADQALSPLSTINGHNGTQAPLLDDGNSTRADPPSAYRKACQGLSHLFLRVSSFGCLVRLQTSLSEPWCRRSRA